MKCVLFALPKDYVHPGLFSNSKKLKKSIYPPLGLLYIASVIENLGHAVEIIDFGIVNFSEELLLKKINSSEFIGINVYSNNYEFANQIAGKIKEYSKDILIIIGGPHCTFLKEKTLEDISYADIAVISEGEKTIIDIIKYLEGKINISDIPGIYYKENNIIKKGKPIEIIKNLDLLPFPARHLVDKYNYGNFPWLDLSKVNFTSIMTSRGCPFHCRFCARYENVIPEWKFRQRSAENVVEEFIEINKKYGFVSIIDDHFLADKKRAHLIFDRLIEYKTDIVIQILGIRVDCSDKTLFKKMKKANVKYISYGIESGNQDVLDFYKKNITLEQIRNSLILADKIGFITSATLIIGAPIETTEHIKNTIKFVCSLPLDFMVIRPLWFDIGSDLWINAVKNNKILKNEYEVPSIKERELSNFTLNELNEYQNMAFRKFYFRTNFLSRQIIKTISDKDTLRLKQLFRAIFYLQFRNIIK